MGLKIFSSFISVVIIFIITFLTFFASSDSKLNYYSKFTIPSNGVFSIIKDKNGDFKEVKEINDSQIFLERFDYLDKIFFNKKGLYTKTQTADSTALKINKGKFFLTFSFPKKYEVFGSGFKLSFVGPIKLYINNENVDKTDIFSFDNMAELTLVGLDDGKDKTKIYVYPHMLFTYNLTLNKVLKNSDLFRISQLIDKMEYVNQSLYTDNFNLDSFVNIDNYFFRSILSYLDNEYLLNKSNDSILKENFNNMTYDYIKKYFYMFVNDNKKVSYYKDLIYMNLLKVYMSPKTSGSLIPEIADYYNNLKLLSKKDYTEMLKVLVYFKSKFLLDNNLDAIDTELKYDQILSSVFSFNKTEGNYILYYIYNLYDLGKKDNFFDGLISFSDTYFKSNGIKIQEDKLLGYDNTLNLKMGYYISFLENIIKSHLLDNTINENTVGIINLFNKYSLLSVSVYSEGTVDKKKTLIVMHLGLLKELSEYIRNNFFEAELDKGIILIKKKGLTLSSNTISLFDKSYNNVYSFFTNNKSVFDENIGNDFLYLKDYEYVSLKFDEYLSALKNYDKYALAKSNLYSIETIGGNDVKKIIYTVGDISSYLANFNGVNKDSIKLKTDETGNIYNVSLGIGGKDFSLELYPYNNFSIKNIYIDGVKKNLAYSLNLIKEKMDEKYKNSSLIEEKNANDFRNFFINTFFKSNTKSRSEVDPKPVVLKEDTDILVFKRDKLLGQRGEFYNIKDFTDIASENINVNIVNDKTEISIKNAKVNFTYILGRESNTYGAYFNSDYYIGNNEHYFSNLKLKLFKIVNDGGNSAEYFGLGNDNYISVGGNVGIESFKDYTGDIVNSYNYITFVNDLLVKKVGQVQISINSSKIVKYTFSFNGKDYEITLLKSSILSVKRDGEKLNNNTLNYTDLANSIDLYIK